MFKKLKLRKQQLDKNFITEESFEQSFQSYLGMLKHCEGYKIERQIKDYFD